jgi:HD-GYP domain-containing protein (c-di-GMP phosphodiesterase class II)
LGLSGDDINKAQRILAVADIMSALYGKRSYKESFDSKKIIEIMHGDVSDGKICPKATLAATEHFDAIIRFYEKQREQTMGIYTKIQEQYVEIYKRFEAFE